MSLNLLFKSLSDESRVRLLLLLRQQELTVAELSEVTQLAQPRVSTHLALLRKNKLVVVRRQGVRSYYRFNQADFEQGYQDFFKMVEEHYRHNPLIERDNARLHQVLLAHSQSNRWVDAVAGDMERHYSPGRTWEATARAINRLLNLGKVLDIGSGDGVLAELLARQCQEYHCADNNARAIKAAEQRLKNYKNVAFRQCDMHHLPFAEHGFDCVLLLHVLTYSEQPQQAINEALRVLKKGGKLLISTLFQHRHQEVMETYGHANLGFEPKQLESWCKQFGGKRVSAQISSQEQRTPNFKIITVEVEK